MKYLITGAAGFVGQHLVNLLYSEGHEVCGIDKVPVTAGESAQLNIREIDIADENALRKLLSEEQPEVIVHLAAISHVPFAWNHICETFNANVIAIATLIKLVAEVCPSARVLSIGSSEEYGYSEDHRMPLTEKAITHPLNPYGISKLAAGHLALRIAQAENIEVIHVRPFNHIGPGQRQGFVTADFASQIARIEAGFQKPIIKVGNLTAKRDFTDVRDVVRAYYLLSMKGRPGEIYNIASRAPTAMQEILNILISLSSVDIKVQEDAELYRKVDIPEYFGAPDKLIAETGWSKDIPLGQSLTDILDYWRKNIN